MFKKSLFLLLLITYSYSNEVEINSNKVEINNKEVTFLGEVYYKSEFETEKLNSKSLKIKMSDKKIIEMVANKNVILEFFNKKMERIYVFGDEVKYNKVTQDINIIGNAVYFNEDLNQKLKADKIYFNRETKKMSSSMFSKDKPVRFTFEKNIKNIKTKILGDIKK